VTVDSYAATGLRKDFGGVGVLGVDLEIPAGSVFGLVGPNGAGKTTLLSMLAGLSTPDSGVIGFGSAEVALCTDVPDFEPWLTAEEVLDLGIHLTRPELSAVDARALRGEVLAKVGLADAARRRVGGFSRGMRQRLGVGAALSAGRPLVLLDEPTSGLDPDGRAAMLDLVESLRGEMTTVFSSHILADVERVCDRIAVLRNGVVVAHGVTADILGAALERTWDIDVVDDAERLARELNTLPWVERASSTGRTRVSVTAVTPSAGHTGLAPVLAGFGLVSLRPRDRGLEDVFDSLVSEVDGPTR
jgi:ABC-2 type transport system ATP-binding protein